ncbi:hypothetical protein WSM22_14610 [Cytophagales bacterium WSM2-2]|nr:hypothetical protein WSM22_14610 [Cytophagales bacterium WSM2-2]
MMKKNSGHRMHFKWLMTSAKFYPLVLLFISSIGFAQKNKPYREDLSSLRPKVEMPPDQKRKDSIRQIRPDVTPTKTINAKVDAILDSIDRVNQTRKFIDGFTIQVYSGQKREDANNMIKKMQEEIPEMIARLRYEQPKFRVVVGKYFTKLEAQSDLLLLKRKFSTASLVPEKIPVK